MADNIIPLNTSDEIQAYAGDWLVRLQRGLTHDEEHELAAWLNQQPRHAATLLEIATVWDRMAVLTELADLLPLPPAPRTARARPAVPRIAAVACACVAAVMLVWMLRDPGISDPGAAGATTAQYQTAVGERSEIALSDGSSLILNTNSAATMHFTDQERRIELLRGDAHFSVATDPTRPFVVLARDTAVRAVGTAFSVMTARPEAVDIIVTEGRVSVYQPRGSAPPHAGEAPTQESEITADAGEMVSIQKSGNVVSAIDDDLLARRLAWHNGMVAFDDEPLAAVIDELGRYSTARFQLADDALAAIPVAGYFRTGDIDALLIALRENFAIAARRERDGTIVLYRP